MLLVLTALFSSILAPYPSDMQFVGFELMPPSWVEGGKISYFFGTDDIGRDSFSRLIIGTSYTLGSALIVVTITVLGSLLGIWLACQED